MSGEGSGKGLGGGVTDRRQDLFFDERNCGRNWNHDWASKGLIWPIRTAQDVQRGASGSDGRERLKTRIEAQSRRGNSRLNKLVD